MNFVGLLAGKGSRMGNLGSYLQKAMYPVLDKPFVQYTLDALIDSQVFDKSKDRIVLVVGHKKEQVLAYFGSSYRDVPLYYVVQEQALGTGHAVLTSMEKANSEETTVVWHGDNFVPSSLFEDIVAHPLACCISVTEYQSSKELKERVELGKDVVKRAWLGTGPCIDTGPWKFDAHMISQIANNSADEYRTLLNVQAQIEKGIPVGYVWNHDWIHLGGTEPSVMENIFACVQSMYRKEIQ